MLPNQRINIIKEWIFEYLSRMSKPANCLVVGVSGGIDSAVVSTFCAMTGFKTLAVSMPIMQRPEHHDLSLKHANWLTTRFRNAYKVELDLTRGYIAWEDIMREFKFKEEHGFANSKSRFRMLSLYQIAASTNGLVVGTGNKVEDFGVGFYTKYGDGGVDISPIADCMKSDVFAMGKELKILQEIIDAEPTDGLWSDGRTDFDQLKMTYKELEGAMQDPSSEKYEQYVSIRKKNLHKMNPIPICKFDGKTTLENN